MRPFVLFPIVLLVGCTAGKNMVVDQLEPTSPDVASESAAEAASPDASSNEMVQDATPNDAGTDAGAPPPSYKHYDINHVLSTGQSDSVANGASPYLTAQQPFGNLSFDVGVMTSKKCNGDGCKAYDTPKGFVPLVEGDKFFDYRVETMSAGFANQASLFATDWFTKTGLPVDHHDILVSLHGRSGNTYWCLRKDSCNYIPGYIQPFAEALMQVESAKTLAAAQGKSYVVRAVTAIHGGSDHYDRENELSFIDRTDGTGLVGNYAEALMEWQRDYETEVRAITGQSESIPLLVSQFGSWTDTVASRIPVRQMEAHVKAHGKVVVVTPNYPFVHYQD
ncbi:MAG TPA: hypothetical protein VM580_10015, partial [Labilithrix sp.]|nr:hypothetical protein [Labilithrix sp.]